MAIVDLYEASLTDTGRYGLLVNAITDYAICMLDPSGLVSSWNRGAQRLEGYEAAEVMHRHFSIFFTSQDQQDGLPDRALKLSADTGSFKCEGWRVRKDASHFWAYVVIDPIRNDGGKLVGFAEITRDLTERKLAEAAASRSEGQFRLLVESVTDYGIFQLDPFGTITSWNAGAERIKGYVAHEIIGRHFTTFYTADDQARQVPQRALESAAREGRCESEGWRVRKAGDVFWAHVVIDAIRDPDGQLLGFAKITRDLTETKKAELAVEAARNALLQSQKLEAIGHLTGGVAHDFNNLLTVILGGLQIIERRLPEDRNITPLLTNAIQAAQRGRSLTQRMLAFARRQDLKPEIIDLSALIGGMSDLLQRTLGPTVTVETDVPASLPAVIADRNQLELAVLNLAINARDALPDGGFINLAARQGSIPNSSGNGHGPEYVCIAVVDWGIGMDAATLSSATEPFFTTKEIGKGTGLGLSMVHGFAEQSGGHFCLKSQPGEGTVAELWLPEALDIIALPPEILEPTAGHVADQDHRLQPVVLAVDDDRLTLMNTATMLNELGYRVYTATSGRQALNVIRKETIPDLIIIDHSMKDMNGLELAEAVQRDWPAIGIIFATPLADPGIRSVSKPSLQQYFEAAIARDAGGDGKAHISGND